MQQVGLKSDPAPSRWAYRFERLMLTPFFRLFLRVILPFLVVFGMAAIWLSDEMRRDQLSGWVHEARVSIETRPEFMVNVMAIDGASVGIAEDIREIMPIDFPISSFDLDLDHIQEQVAGLPAVASATVRIRPGGIMQITITERDPVMVWRSRDGLFLVDQEGFVVAPARSRSEHANLPLMAGAGAELHVVEARSLFVAAEPLRSQLRGLVRVGERRWDMVLKDGQRILLPEEGAVQALERVIALSQAQDLLARDLTIVDMRLPERPTLRIAERSVEDWWRLRRLEVGNTEE
ncbi:cell division protein FtsQ/DivIB [Shimia sp. FJ5]|uniref:cell division protein FtsQ/DivIB n=1 Tax=Shimia sp. FJ5 TaxID=3079054 RepID=UPI00262EEF6A|nr:cell division protein FtsQ/DivIB [Shimia sp. FJ5]MDV4143838.1 cell division protein FtsQ/DivIB [Shimia sp. FJ5]